MSLTKITLMLSVLLWLPIAARAETINITSGFVVADTQIGDPYYEGVLAGSGFRLDFYHERFFGSIPYSLEPGDTVNFGNILEPSGFIQLTVGDQTYDSENDFLSVRLLFETDKTFIVPSIGPPNEDGEYDGFFPHWQFTLTGDIVVGEGTNSRSFLLLGKGTARAGYFVPGPDTSYELSFYFYEIQPAAPVPEPTTMLLLGTGLAGVGTVAHKRRKTNKRR